MSDTNVKRNVNSIGFVNHAHMAFTPDPVKLSGKEYTKNRLENIGGKLNWGFTQLPKKICQAFSDPKVLTVAFTALAMLSIRIIFYPCVTWRDIKTVCSFVAKHIPPKVIKISIYFFTQINIFGYGIRALGRFSNEELMDNWYKKPEPRHALAT